MLLRSLNKEFIWAGVRVAMKYAAPSAVVVPALLVFRHSIVRHFTTAPKKETRPDPPADPLKLGPRLDAYKWPSIRQWNSNICAFFGLRYQIHDQWPDAMPVPLDNTQLQGDLLAICTALGTPSFLSTGDFNAYTKEARCFFRQLRAVTLGTHEGVVDALSFELVRLIDMGLESTVLQHDVSVRIGNTDVTGTVDVAVLRANKKIILHIFEDKISPFATGYVEQGRPQILGYMMATCLRNLGEGVVNRFVDQEIFCVNMKNTRLSFCYLKLSAATLEHLYNGTPPTETSVMHFFPQLGYDLREAPQCTAAFKGLLTIKNYLSAGNPRIGQY